MIKKKSIAYKKNNRFKLIFYKKWNNIYKEFFKIVHFKIIIKNPKMLKNSSIKKLD